MKKDITLEKELLLEAIHRIQEGILLLPDNEHTDRAWSALCEFYNKQKEQP